MDSSSQLAFGHHSQPVIAGLDRGVDASYVEDHNAVEQILLDHFDLRNGTEKFEQVATAASDKAGRVGIHALPGTAMREAHNTGAEELNRILSRCDGWDPIREGQLHYHFNKDRNIAILYQNVDKACFRTVSPKNITKKGIETERLVWTPANHTFPLFKPQPQIWFLCTSFNNQEADTDLRIELSMPQPFFGYFGEFYARLIIQHGSESTHHQPVGSKDIPMDDSFDSELPDLDFDFRTTG